MLDMTVILSKMISLFLLIVLGYVCTRVHWMNKAFSAQLSKLVTNVALPAMVLSSAMGDGVGLSGSKLLDVAGVGLILFGYLCVAAVFLPRLWRSPREELGTYRFMTLFPNTAFMGYPVVSALFGSGAVVYGAVFNVAFHLGLFSVGTLMLSGGGEQRKGVEWKRLLNPGVFAAAGALVLLLTGVKVPAAIGDMVDMTGAATTPLAMMIVGANLAEMSLGEVFRSGRMYVYSLFRLLLLPVGLWLILRPFVADGVVLGTAVAMAGMPAAANATVMAAEYGGNEKLATQGVLLSTLLSVITIPVLMGCLF